MFRDALNVCDNSVGLVGPVTHLRSSGLAHRAHRERKGERERGQKHFGSHQTLQPSCTFLKRR